MRNYLTMIVALAFLVFCQPVWTEAKEEPCALCDTKRRFDYSTIDWTDEVITMRLEDLQSLINEVKALRREHQSRCGR